MRNIRATHLLALLALPMIAAATAMPVQVQGLRISGLLPFEQGVSGQATPATAGGSLDIPLDERRLRITPWPAFLPQEFEAQQIDARRQAAPAGPSDRLSMRRAEGEAPWLEVAAGARESTPVVGGWKLKHTVRGWWLAQGTKLHFLGQDAERARPVTAPAGMERWCVHLLDSSVPEQRSGAAQEGEAQAGWVAVRMTRGERCGTAGTGGTSAAAAAAAAAAAKR